MKKPIPFGKYYLLDRISVGGMAEVFKAKAFGVEGFERLIAVKRILPSIAEDEEFITMFIDEAKIAVQLQHANIAQIFDLGKVGDSFFIALEYVPGKDLRSIFDNLRKESRALPVPMASYITMKVCEGLDYAHNKKDAAGRDLNLVHRDVSPQNVLISYDGEIKLIDFGIAKAAGKAGKTQAGILKGKFGYMSPEQVRGLPLDRRSDIFAVGICMWEMITGERLFVGESDFSTLEKVRNVEINPPSTYNRNIPADLEKIVLRALSKEVEDRYQSAMDLHDDLQSWMYTSGNFFARKDLGGFMSEVFKDDIRREIESNEGSKQRSTIPPPITSRSDTGSGRSRPGAPPPQRVSQPPPPPPTKGSGSVPRPQAARPPMAKPSSSIRNTSPVLGQPPIQAPVGQPMTPGMPKRTMLGTPEVRAPSPGAQQSFADAGQALPPDLASGRVATPMAPGADAGIAMAEWDEEEPSTSIYSKKTAAEMAKEVTARDGRERQAGLRAVPDVLPEEEEIEELELVEVRTVSEKRSKIPLVLGSAVAAIAIVTALVLILFYEKTKVDIGTLRLEVDPTDKLKVVLDGTNSISGDKSPFEVSELKPGDHMVVVSREGYKDKQIKVTIKAGETLARVVELDKSSSGFFLETDPPGASVWIDDRPLEEKTPVTVEDLEPGTHVLRIAKGESYAQKTIEVEVTEGEINKIPLKVLDLKAVEVTFNTEPPGARAVLISGKDQRDLGNTPAIGVLDSSKEYRIKLTKDGYREVKKDVEYPPGQEKFALAAVQLVATRTGSSSASRSGVRSTPRIKPVSTSSSPSTPRTPKATGGSGKLSVQTKPWSKVYVDGKFIKNTPLVNHKLKAGQHTVTVENPSYNIKKSFRVVVRPNKTTTLVKTLI